MLLLKTLRDLRLSAVSYAAIAVVVVLGITFLIGSASVYQNLRGSYDQSYRKLRFEDFNIRFHAVPARVIDQIRKIPGVATAEGRWVEDTALKLKAKPGAKVVGRLVGIPTDRGLANNQLKLVAGRMLDSGEARSVLIEANFAAYHKLRPGDQLVAERGSVEVPLHIVGVVQSCEYLYVVRSKQDLISIPDTFGVMFLDETALGRLFGRLDEINEIHATVTSLDHRASAMLSVRQALQAYDPELPVAREDQPSYQILEQDVKGFQSYAVLFPLLFLGVAVASVSTLLTRQIHAQRTTIGLLRSLGFSRQAVQVHFLSSAVVVGAIASVLGAVVGVWVGRSLSLYYMSQLQVPYPEIIPRWPSVWIGVAVGTLTCAGAGIAPARHASRFAPAEAMRPATPSYGRRSLRLDRWLKTASLFVRIPLRNVLRQPRRTLSTLIGVVSALCLMVTARGLLDSITYALDEMMSGMFGYDLRIDFIQYQSRRSVETVKSWPGVAWAEGVLEVPMEFRKGGRSYSAVLNGVESGSPLRHLRGEDGELVSIPASGAIFGQAVKSKLNLKLGDVVWASLPENMTIESSRPVAIRVAGFNKEAVGTQAYASRPEVERLFRRELALPGNAISGVIVRADSDHLADIRRRALDLPYAGSAMLRVSLRSMIERLIQTSQRFVLIMEVFGFVLAFAALFNTVTINVLERRAEMATLRTLGIDGRQIGFMVALENLVVAAMGLVIGLPIARGFVQLFWQAAQTPEQQELMTFDVRVLPATFVYAAAAVIAITVIALVPSLRTIQQMDLARSVKERAT